MGNFEQNYPQDWKVSVTAIRGAVYQLQWKPWWKAESWGHRTMKYVWGIDISQEQFFSEASMLVCNDNLDLTLTPWPCVI